MCSRGKFDRLRRRRHGIYYDFGRNDDKYVLQFGGVQRNGLEGRV